MAGDTRKIAFEDDNPEWTEADVARAADRRLPGIGSGLSKRQQTTR